MNQKALTMVLTIAVVGVNATNFVLRQDYQKAASNPNTQEEQPADSPFNASPDPIPSFPSSEIPADTVAPLTSNGGQSKPASSAKPQSSTKPATIKGNLIDAVGEPVGAGVVTMKNENGDLLDSVSITADAKGFFTIKEGTPGENLTVGFEDIEANTYHSTVLVTIQPDKVNSIGEHQVVPDNSVDGTNPIEEGSPNDGRVPL